MESDSTAPKSSSVYPWRFVENACVAIEALVFDIGDVLEVRAPAGLSDGRLVCTRPLLQFERRLGEIWGPGSVDRSTLEGIEHGRVQSR